jgi:hypothetical protein
VFAEEIASSYQHILSGKISTSQAIKIDFADLIRLKQLQRRVPPCMF